jgi:hypothetical protein
MLASRPIRLRRILPQKRSKAAQQSIQKRRPSTIVLGRSLFKYPESNESLRYRKKSILRQPRDWKLPPTSPDLISTECWNSHSRGFTKTVNGRLTLLTELLYFPAVRPPVESQGTIEFQSSPLRARSEASYEYRIILSRASREAA